MDFGKVDDLSAIDFTLPAPHPLTAQVLANSPKVAQPQIYIGPPVWSNKEWVGKIYPSTAREKDFLHHYSRQFNTIELNVTHYQIPSETTIVRWRESVPDHFRFCPKWPQSISHEAQLVNVMLPSSQFIEAVQGLGPALGTTFLQLGPSFDTSKWAALENFLKGIPEGFPLAVEFRHPGWFEDQAQWQKTMDYFRQHNIGTVMSDVAGRRDVLHMCLPTPTLVLRFVGNDLHPTDYSRTDVWVDQLKLWFKDGLQTAYIFIHCGENTRAPELTRYWIEELNAKTGLSVEPPIIRPQVVQGSLF